MIQYTRVHVWVLCISIFVRRLKYHLINEKKQSGDLSHVKKLPHFMNELEKICILAPGFPGFPG